MRFWISDFQIFHDFDHDNLDPWIMDDKILKSPKSRYSPLDRGALTTKVCGRNRSLLFSLSGRVWYRQIIFSIDFQLDFHDFQ